ncbi:hypothetical protein DFQ01_109145 [Paenibacillus cellulosilyticus]|uniref:HTH cro/C1-type domain-containing protein n=1 Tax=Paenibacillus cellulosilyticus TaxID=375489 RepID=A0A2V2YVM7_9BACL|nr:helix-turn-helix transcriptional regulator [Paenibacillus cellulosilyticus]PWW02520.1 hypothetical protein DFQ01_109145 [Paenibacillus cellulosilyticus]QKS47217.1 hypothetical protein HUB94_22525 [Paenibacillus cellulosilyticus]
MIGLEFICKVHKKDQKEIAEKLKIAAPNISSWLKGTRDIPSKYLPILSKIFRGISSEYFQKELTYVDELKIRIHRIETMEFEDRHEPFIVPNGVDYDDLLIDEYVDDYENELAYLYKELNKTLQVDSYQNRISSLIELLKGLDKENQQTEFQDRSAEEHILTKLNSYLDFLQKFNVKGINTLDSIVTYFNLYDGVDRKKWYTQEMFPNEKQLSFYSDFKDLLIKHGVM